MSKVLLVDDDIDLAELVKTKLSGDGHEVFTIHSGEGAFEMAKQVKPELVVLDIMLPGATGYQICRRLRKDPELYSAGILILTALGEEPEIMHGLEQGADDYMAKPFKLDTLVEKLTTLENLLQATKKKNPVTELPGTEAIKREINHKLARGTAIAACYIDMVGFKAYGAAYGQEAQQKALQFLSKLLRHEARQLGIYEMFIAHLGGEHFVVLVNLEDYERYIASVMKTFDERVKQIYKPDDAEKGYLKVRDKRGEERKVSLMALAVGIAHTQFRQFKSAKKMFEVLAQCRQMAKPQGGSEMFVDRRKADR
jgi:DNA-binding response OmpR family regulator